MPLKFGLALMNDFPPDVVPAARVAALREQARAADEAGISSIWALQHYLGNMPTLQPLHLLSALAEDTGDMSLGTNMFILPLRHPVGVAEEFATLDHLSGGRAIAGFGLGYRENEFAAFGVPMEERLGRFEEGVEVVRRLWSGVPTTFRGDHVVVDDETISLPPVQSGGPPIWIGAGAHRAGARRAARLGDAWIVPPHVDPEKLARLLTDYSAERARLGRGHTQLVARRELVLDRDRARARKIGLAARGALTRQYAAFNAPDQAGNYAHLASDRAAEETADRAYLFTDPEGAVTALKELEAQGVTDVILRMQWYDLPQDQVLATMAIFRDEVLPLLR